MDSTTVCSPTACKTLAESTLADDFTNPSVATDVAVASLTALDLPFGCASLAEEDTFTHNLSDSFSLDEISLAQGTSTLFSDPSNDSLLVADDSLHHPTLNYSPDTSLDTTVNPAVQSGDFKKVVELMQKEHYPMMKSITSLQAILILTELTDFHLMKW